MKNADNCPWKAATLDKQISEQAARRRSGRTFKRAEEGSRR